MNQKGNAGLGPLQAGKADLHIARILRKHRLCDPVQDELVDLDNLSGLVPNTAFEIEPALRIQTQHPLWRR
jgi:hypothetical protein